MKNHGGRRGGLSPGQAEHAEQIRTIGACLRCRLFRIKCDAGDPCTPCQKRMRRWKLGCTRELLEDRSEYLYPKLLAADARESHTNDFMKAVHWLGLPFHIPLTQNLGRRPMYIVVRERHRSELEGQAVNSKSPPLLPYWGTKKEEYELTVEKTLRDWLQRMASSDLPRYCFNEPEETLWERDVLGAICTYSETHEGLEDAFKLTFLIHMSIHPFVIPKEDLKDVFRRLQQPGFGDPEGDEISPMGIQNFLTMHVFRLFETVAAETLNGLSNRFTSRDKTPAELVFCEAYLCLIVVGRCQILILNHARTTEKPVEFTLDMAIQHIRRMEDQLAKHIIELCICKFRKEAISASCLSPFFGGLLQITSKHLKLSADDGSLAEFFNNSTMLGEINTDNFGATNVRRLLVRLYQSGSEFWAQREQETGSSLIEMAV